ncbi:MAG: rod shape-determining protein MreC [Minisyncoccia bacterium]
MTYHLKSKSKSELTPKIIVAVFLFVFLSLAQYFFSSGLRTFTYYVTKPVWKVSEITQKPFTYLSGYLRAKSDLINENKELKDSLFKLSLKSSDYDLLQKENDSLKSQIGDSNQSKKIVVEIVSKPPQSPYDTFVLDAGIAEGVKQGSKAYISDKMIVGIVKESYLHTSIVELFSTQGIDSTVTMVRTGDSFVITGLGGGNYKLEIPKDADVVWGDTFIYPGTGESAIGSIYYIDTNTQSAFKTAYIRSPVNTFSYKNFLIEPSP